MLESFPEMCLPVTFNSPTISSRLIIAPPIISSSLSIFHYISHCDFFFLNTESQRNNFHVFHVFVSHGRGAAWSSGVHEIFISFYFEVP